MRSSAEAVEIPDPFYPPPSKKKSVFQSLHRIALRDSYLNIERSESDCM